MTNSDIVYSNHIGNKCYYLFITIDGVAFGKQEGDKKLVYIFSENYHKTKHIFDITRAYLPGSNKYILTDPILDNNRVIKYELMMDYRYLDTSKRFKFSIDMGIGLDIFSFYHDFWIHHIDNNYAARMSGLYYTYKQIKKAYLFCTKHNEQVTKIVKSLFKAGQTIKINYENVDKFINMIKSFNDIDKYSYYRKSIKLYDDKQSFYQDVFVRTIWNNTYGNIFPVWPVRYMRNYEYAYLKMIGKFEKFTNECLKHRIEIL